MLRPIEQTGKLRFGEAESQEVDVLTQPLCATPKPGLRRCAGGLSHTLRSSGEPGRTRGLQRLVFAPHGQLKPDGSWPRRPRAHVINQYGQILSFACPRLPSRTPSPPPGMSQILAEPQIAVLCVYPQYSLLP